MLGGQNGGSTVIQFFRNMNQERCNYFQEFRNNFSISVFINLKKLYFLETTQEDIKKTYNIFP